MSAPLAPSQREALLRVARQALEQAVGGASVPPDLPGDPLLHQPGAAFVTLTHGGELRGCIGSLERDLPLADVVARCAISSATGDPRFYPVTASELPALRIEISVLTPLRRVDNPEEVEVGQHGLLIRRGLRRGLLLPQVAIEHGWTRETFLAQTCLKAGLPLDAWRTDAEIWVFEAEVFGESS